jgi:hypothetical protein
LSLISILNSRKEEKTMSPTIELNLDFSNIESGGYKGRKIRIEKGQMAKLVGLASHLAWVECVRQGKMKGNSATTVDFHAHKQMTGKLIRNWVSSAIKSAISNITVQGAGAA